MNTNTEFCTVHFKYIYGSFSRILEGFFQNSKKELSVYMQLVLAGYAIP